MKLNFRMSVWSLLLLAAFFLAAHPELLEFKFTPRRYNVLHAVVREGVANDQSWAITRIAFSPEKIPFVKIQNRNRSLRAFFYNDALYVEQHEPREVFLISGNFWTEPDIKNIHFTDTMTLFVRGVTAQYGVQVPIVLRIHLDTGVIEMIQS
ncbi:MAG TPA: hypothetical protein VJ579_02050 [Candidatus Paceibacterota bacterium]|nr:hypothetical protein [Candidatus Paceibacterota bacterium]